MAAAPNHFGELFVSITGHSTLTEPQHVEEHHLDTGQLTDVSTYLHDTLRANGLDDAIADPDTQ